MRFPFDNLQFSNLIIFIIYCQNLSEQGSKTFKIIPEIKCKGKQQQQKNQIKSRNREIKLQISRQKSILKFAGDSVIQFDFGGCNNIDMLIQKGQTNVAPVLNPAAQMVNYIKTKCNMAQDQIQKKLVNGQVFDMMKGEGTDIDTKLIQQILNDNDFYQKQSQKLLKDEAMKFICDIVQQWSIQIAKNEMRINQEQIYSYTAKLLPFGSYVLDLRSNSSDIDFICVCPNFIQRQTHFFDGLANRLLSKLQVKNLATRPNARVPIITFSYKQIQIDISFCQLQTETIPRDIEKVISLDLLNTIKDDQSRTSLLGRKNNLMIVQLTGKQAQNFKQTLRLVKVWAKNRGISSNVMGYLGGISWAILVAKICQIFPNHKPLKLLHEFFFIYSMWNWKVPVRLAPLPQGQAEDKGPQALMSIITPASEYNSTQRVNAVTYKVITDQIRRAAQILYSRKELSDICKKIDFFGIYPLFIEIDVNGMNNSKDEEKQYKDFQGLVESRILKLIQLIIRYYKKQIDQGTFKIVPFPKMFKKNDVVYSLSNSLFIGVDLNSEMNVNLCRAVKEWCVMIEQSRSSKSQNIRVFETFKEEINDVQIVEAKKIKESKQDPRLAMRKKKIQTQ